MSKLTREQVLKLAQLSRLKLSDDEIERFQNELSAILTYVETLERTDTEGLKPTYQVTGLKNVMRDDKPIVYQASPSDILNIAPVLEKHQYKVKRVLE